MTEKRRRGCRMTLEHLVVQREESENQVVKGVGLSYCMLAVRVDGLMGLRLFFRVRRQLVITMTK